MDIATIEDKLIETVQALGIFAVVQSAGRKVLPEVCAYPACFVFFDGDKSASAYPRPIDEVNFSVAIQAQNLAYEGQAAKDVYVLNDLVRDAIRGKILGLDGIEPFTCVTRRCSGYDDADGIIEYTHNYRTRLSSPVPVE